MVATHLVELDEGPVPHKKRRCRTSKKKRLRAKKRVSLEPKVDIKDDEIQSNKDEPMKDQQHIQHKGTEVQRIDVQHHKQQQKMEPVNCSKQLQLTQIRAEDVNDLEASQRDEISTLLSAKPKSKTTDIQPAQSSPIEMKRHFSSDNSSVHLQRQLEANAVSTNQETGQDEQQGPHNGHNEQSEGEITEYERKRRKQILRNQAFLEQVGVSAAKLAARTAIGDEAQKEARRQELAAKRVLTAARRAELLKRPKRMSQRLGSEKVSVLTHSMDLGHPLDMFYVNKMRQRLDSKLYVMDATDEEGAAFCKEIAGDLDVLEKNEAVNVNDDVDYSLADNDVVKVLPYHTTTMAFLPRADRVVVAGGDKEGHVALWSPCTDASSSSIALSRPHGYPLSHLIFPDSSTLVSSSIDGTVREFDLCTAQSSPICDLSDEAGITSLIGSGNPQFYYASCEDGTLRLVDRRARMAHSSRYALHMKRINSVDQHPSLDFCIATASKDATVCLWDKRKISSEESVALARLRHKTNMLSAHFSPQDGTWLTAVSLDSYFDMYDTSNLVKCQAWDVNPFTLSNWVRVPHNIKTAVRTNPRPAWDPKRTNRFVIASLDQPVTLQIFRAGQSQPIQELKTKSVDMVNVYHPHLDLIASGNSAGRLSLWRGKPKM